MHLKNNKIKEKKTNTAHDPQALYLSKKDLSAYFLPH